MIENVEKLQVAQSSYRQEGLFNEKSNGSASNTDNRKGLATIWEEIVKNNSLPVNFDVETFFLIIKERLNSPEWEVRQHALRVLKDFIPVVNPQTLETNIETVLVDILNNLGNSAPSVRKTSQDCLYTYVKNSNDPDNSIRNVVFTGLYKESSNNHSHLKTNTIAGIIMALPTLILPHLSQETLFYVITALFNKLIQVTYQEVALKALLRMENVLGKDRFRNIMNVCGYEDRIKDLELLSEVYGIDGNELDDSESGKKASEVDAEEDEYFDGFLSDTAVTIVEPEEDDVILEAEIKLETGDAITMKVHEENPSVSPSFESDDSQKEQNRTDVYSSEETSNIEDKKELIPRSPRKVRFGGEVIKMRTPDSDGQSSDNSKTKSNSDNNKLNKSNIPVRIQKTKKREENYEDSDNSNKSSLVEHSRKSFIPVRKTDIDYNFNDLPKSFSIYPDENDTNFPLNNGHEMYGRNKNFIGIRPSLSSNNIRTSDGLLNGNSRWRSRSKSPNRENNFRNGHTRTYMPFHPTNTIRPSTSNFGFPDLNDPRSKYQQMKRGYRHENVSNYVPSGTFWDRTNHSAPEIYHQNSRFFGNDSPSIVVENGSYKYNNNLERRTTNSSLENASKSPSNSSSHSTTDGIIPLKISPKKSPINRAETPVESSIEDLFVSREEISKNSPSNKRFSSGSKTPENFPLIANKIESETKGMEERFKNLNLSKSDSDLRYSSPQESRTFSNSAPSAVKSVILTPIKREESLPKLDLKTSSSNPDSLNKTTSNDVQIRNANSRGKSRILPALNNSSISNNKSFGFRKNLKKIETPRQNLNVTMIQLESKDWEINIKGLQALSLLIKEQSIQLNGHLHSVCILIGKHIRSLRSQVARCACNAAADLFTFPIKGVEMEVEDLASSLFSRTADTNKFLRSDAKSALEKMCDNLPPTKVISVILNKGAIHHNPLVRCESARLLNSVSKIVGYEKIYQMPKDTKEKILKTTANFLGEGCYETRQHAQNLLLLLRQHKHFWKCVVNVLSPSNVRAVGNVIQKRL